MQTETEPAGPSSVDAVSRARPGGPGRKERALSLVDAGFVVLYWAVLVQCAAIVVLVASGLFPTPRVIPVVALIALLVGDLMQIAGRLLCLFVPRESRAKRLGRYLRRADLAVEAQWLINAVPALVAIVLITGVGGSFLLYQLCPSGPGFFLPVPPISLFILHRFHWSDYPSADSLPAAPGRPSPRTAARKRRVSSSRG